MLSNPRFLHNPKTFYIIPTVAPYHFTPLKPTTSPTFEQLNNRTSPMHHRLFTLGLLLRKHRSTFSILNKKKHYKIVVKLIIQIFRFQEYKLLNLRLRILFAIVSRVEMTFGIMLVLSADPFLTMF